MDERMREYWRARKIGLTQLDGLIIEDRKGHPFQLHVRHEGFACVWLTPFKRKNRPIVTAYECKEG